MKTEVIAASAQAEAGTSRGAELIRKGELVAFPTETVYGLGANGLNEAAVLRIFEAKGRPADNPLILHVARKNDVRKLWSHVPAIAGTLMDTFWPGPLTLIFTRAACVPDAVTAGLDTVAVRMPSDRTAQMLIRKAETPIAAPSANRSGRPSPTTAAHVLEDMDGRIPLILDGGPCTYGVESTVLSLCGKPTILRPGAVTREMLEAVIGPVALAPSILQPLGRHETAASPGMKYKHYAPQAEVLVVTGEPKAAAARIRTLYRQYDQEGKRCCIAATKQTFGFYRGLDAVTLGDRNDPLTLCQSLFATLRTLDARADVILTEGVAADDAGLAFMNRLLRSAGFHQESV